MALAAENRNREIYRYRKYIADKINLPAHQNYMFSAEGATVELKKYEKHKKLTFFRKEMNKKESVHGFMQKMLENEALTPELIASIVCDEALEIYYRR